MKRLSVQAGLYAGVKNIDEIFEIKELDDPIDITALVSLDDNEHNIVNDFIAFMDYIYENSEGECSTARGESIVKVYLLPGVISKDALPEVTYQLGDKTEFKGFANYIASSGRFCICPVLPNKTYIDFSDTPLVTHDVRMIVTQIGWDAAYTIFQNVVMKELLKFSHLFYYDKWDHAIQIKDADKDKYELFTMYNEIIFDIVDEVEECLK